MRRLRTIIALGGGGFSLVKFDPKLCRYIMAQSGRRSPRICFVTTASGDCPAVIDKLSQQAAKLGAKPSHLSLFNQPLEPLRPFVLKHDIVYVYGGNTRNLLLLWKAWGLDKVLREAYEHGIVLAGQSAGALCWFQGGVTDSFPGRYAPLRCLGFLRGSFCPHFDSEPKRRPVYRQLVRERVLPGGYAADDNVALHYVNEKLVRIVSSRRRATAHHVYRTGRTLIEEKIRPHVL
jgi:peptidase E